MEDVQRDNMSTGLAWRTGFVEVPGIALDGMYLVTPAVSDNSRLLGGDVV